ncbi:ribonuclease H-like domain-containing protein [Lactarius indigo]|nr:ribonuclease H-like domain-containing protein [Lactarius indigo]
MVEVLERLQSEWKVTVVAFTTDASGESRKARKLLLVNLIVGDYFKAESIYVKHSKMASDLISWLRSKMYVLARLQEIQTQNGRPPLTVIRAVLTRWTAHYLAFKRLLELELPLRTLITQDAMASSDQQVFISPGLTTANKRKAREMKAVIEDSTFWHSLARLKTHLEPLARAANVAQAAFCRLDQILLTFGSLSIYYREIMDQDPDNAIGCTAILNSIEKRWAKADQDIFIAAVLLNPFVKTAAFSPRVSFLTRAGVFTLLKRLYQRFFSITESPDQLSANINTLFTNIQDYFSEHGGDLAAYAGPIKDRAQANGVSPDPVELYEGMVPITAGSPPTPLFKLALHILSICPNSASCKRLFSVFGNTLTKLRNRLGKSTLTSLAELKMHIHDEHVRNGDTKQRLKRFYGTTSRASPSSGQLESLLTPPLLDDEAGDIAMDIDPVLQQLLDGETDDFNRITESFGRQSDYDNDDRDGQMPSTISITIVDLFNHAEKNWISLHERSASRSLNEELELYELLNSDPAGVEGVDVEIDHALDSIFVV